MGGCGRLPVRPGYARSLKGRREDVTEEVTLLLEPVWEGAPGRGNRSAQRSGSWEKGKEANLAADRPGPRGMEVMQCAVPRLVTIASGGSLTGPLGQDRGKGCRSTSPDSGLS
ncbi:hypothetical protein H1C71_028645 [Ictidomys tridecemlineatus]|nr:hypothetical protein H1C71_028645 [Ictidomys tridecemlineatus]